MTRGYTSTHCAGCFKKKSAASSSAPIRVRIRRGCSPEPRTASIMVAENIERVRAGRTPLALVNVEAEY